jgi:hypothetical protein
MSKQRVYLLAVAVWLLLLVLAVCLGAVRELALAPAIGGLNPCEALLDGGVDFCPFSCMGRPRRVLVAGVILAGMRRRSVP